LKTFHGGGLVTRDRFCCGPANLLDSRRNVPVLPQRRLFR
jgi:hypothetical protein